VTSQGSALTRFRRALAASDGGGAYAAATELPHVDLADALMLTLLLADDWKPYERACVRWVGRLALEVPGIPLTSAHLALVALSSLGRGRTAGAHALAELFNELGRSDLADVVEVWLTKRATDSAHDRPSNEERAAHYGRPLPKSARAEARTCDRPGLVLLLQLDLAVEHLGVAKEGGVRLLGR
jgi:hypothetical protein